MYFSNIEYCMKMMYIIGAHPEKSGSKTQTLLYLFTLSLNFSVLYLIVLLFVYKSDTLVLTDVTDALESGLVTTHGCIKLTALYLKRPVWLDLFRRTTKFWSFEEVKNEKIREECYTQMKRLKSTFYLFLLVSAVPMFFFILRPFFLGEDVLTFSCYKPENVPKLVIEIAHGYVYFGICVSAIAFDVCFYTMVVLLQIQFKVFNYKIRCLFDGEEEEGALKKKVKELVDYHNYLIGIANKVNETTSTTLLLYFGINLFSMCVELYVIQTQDSNLSNSLKSISYMLALSMQYVAYYCVPSQFLTDEAEKILDGAWCSNWYNSPSSSTKFAMRMIMIRAQKPLYMTAGKFIYINLQTCLSTIKTAVSYYMFLRTMSKGGE